MCGVCGCQVTGSKVVTIAELMAAGSVMVVTEGTLQSGLEQAGWMKAIVRAVAMVVARAEVTRAAVMNMVKVHGRDGEGDERLTMASTLMKVMTVSAATVRAWTSVSAVAVGVDVEGTR